MLDLLGTLVTRVFFAGFEAAVKSVLRKDRHEKHEARTPSALLVRRVDGEYRSWAEAHGMTWDDELHAWRGRLSRCAVRVRPGLAGSSPGYVLVDVEIAHDHTEPVLVTSSSPRTEPLVRAMAEVFENGDLEGKLRTISLVPNGVSLRLAALTQPEIVECAIDTAVERLSRNERPYR
jgi:hypothetical protein